MLKLFAIFKDGFVAIFTAPFWLAYFIYKIIESILLFFIVGVKAVVLYFRGEFFFKTKEDRAIEQLRQEDINKLTERKQEALRNADKVL